MIFMLMTLTLLAGTLLSFQSLSLFFYYAAYYGLCFVALRSFAYGKDFFLSFQQGPATRGESKLMVAGQEISPQTEEDRQEDRFLNVFETHRVVKRKILSWVLFLGGVWFFYYQQGVELSVNTLVPVLSCFLIVNSFYVGHFLLGLLLNALMVAYNFSPQVSIVFYLLYALLFFASLYLIGTKENFFSQKKVTALSLITLLFLALCFGFSWLLPKELRFGEDDQPLPAEVARPMKEYLRKSRADLGAMASKLAGLNMSGDLLKQISGQLSDISKLELKLNRPDVSAAERLQIKEEMAALMNNTQSIKDQFKQLSLPNGLGGLSSADKDILEQLGNGELTQEQRNTVRSLLNRSQGSEDSRALDELLNKEKLTSEEMQQLLQSVEKLKNVQQELEQKAREKKFGAATLTEEPAPAEKAEILKPLSEEKQKDLVDSLKKFLPILVLAFIVILIHYLLRKKGIKKIEASDPEVLEELKEEWKKLKRLKLSPKEEVIHYYNLFHESLQRLHYTEHEAPPSCVIYEDMKEFNPELEKSTLVITEVFAQCFYGEKQVSREALKLFRRALAKILKVYQLN